MNARELRDMRRRCNVALFSASVAVTLASTPAASAGTEACFDEMSQTYAWDDQGVLWRSMKHCPGEPAPEDWAERRLGGRMQIHVSGHDVSIVEESYAWVPHADSPPGQCAVFYKSVTRKTHTAKDGVVYETRQFEDQPAVSSQGTLKDGHYLYEGSLASVPPPGLPGLQLGGTDTIAGQPCQRVSPPSVPGGAVTTFCVFVVPRTCFTSHFVQPLEQRTVAPDGTVSVLGRTTELRIGKIGEVLPKNALTAP